jgi:hypothetical protein
MPLRDEVRLSCVKDLGQFLLVVLVRLLSGFGGRRVLRQGSVAEAGMQPLAVIEDFDVLGHCESSSGSGGETLPRAHFVFQGRE